MSQSWSLAYLAVPGCTRPNRSTSRRLWAMIGSACATVRNDRAFIINRFAETCDLAAPFGLTVNHEYPAFSRLTCLEDATDILRAARCPNQGLLVDTLYYITSAMAAPPPVRCCRAGCACDP